MKDLEAWLSMLGAPSGERPRGDAVPASTFEGEDFLAEWYEQACGGAHPQRVLMLFPKGLSVPAPAVAVPFYYPEAMLGYDPATGEELSRFAGIEMMLQLVRRGYVVASADAYT